MLSMSYSKEQEGTASPEPAPQEPEKPAPKAPPIPLVLALPLVLEAIISQTQFPVPGKEDFFKLADELEESTPSDLDLTPEGLSLVIQMLQR